MRSEDKGVIGRELSDVSISLPYNKIHSKVRSVPSISRNMWCLNDFTDILNSLTNETAV